MGVVLVIALVLLVVILIASDKKDAATSNAQTQTSQQSVPHISPYISVEPCEFCDKIYFNSTGIYSAIREKIGIDPIMMYDSDRVSQKSFVKKMDPISILHFTWQEYFRTTSTKGMIIDKTREEPIISPCEGYIIYHPIPMSRNGSKFLLASIYKDYETLLEQEFAFNYQIKKDDFDNTYSIVWERLNGEKRTHYLWIGGTVLKLIRVSFALEENMPVLLVWHKFGLTSYLWIDLLFEDKTVLSFPFAKNVRVLESVIPINPGDIDCLSTKKILNIRLRGNERPHDYAIEADEQEALVRFASSFKQAVESIADGDGLQAWYEKIEKEHAEKEALKKEEEALRKKEEESCWVYLMHDLANNAYKIGISNKPEYRERTLQSEKPSIEKLAAKQFPTRDIARAFEAALHKVYETRRMRGEWFKLEPNEVEDVKKALE